MMSKEKKQVYISEMSSQLDKAEAVIVAHYQGLTVKQLDELRKKMREHGIQFKITKNRITKLALEKTSRKDLSNLFSGPTAVAMSDDAITSAKILTNFSKDNQNLKLIAEYLGHRSLNTTTKYVHASHGAKKKLLQKRMRSAA